MLKMRKGGSFFAGRLPQDYPVKMVWKRGFIQLVLVAGILWMLLILIVSLFHLCNREGKLFMALDTMGLVQNLQHRCPIPFANDPDRVVIPEGRTQDEIVKKLTYVTEDEFANNGSQSSPLFGGHQNWLQREESFKLKPTTKVPCGFMKNGGAEMDPADVEYVKKCRFVGASGIFDKKDSDGGLWVGIWLLILFKHRPYDEPRRNGKVPKILTHRLFPEAWYSIWIDGKMELIVDPLLILERYLWRGKHTYAIAQHKYHRSIYEEADANKRRKRYATPLIHLHMKIDCYEGMEPWSLKKNIISDVLEGAIIIREHTLLNNVFSCLWFNEVHFFTPRDQLSFGYVVYRLGGSFKFHMFPNCEYNSLFVLRLHNREPSSEVGWVKSWSEFKGNGSSLKEPGNLDSVFLPKVVRTSKAS